jgi:signal transduction histidine kinase/CheY-like chemotaxis protein
MFLIKSGKFLVFILFFLLFCFETGKTQSYPIEKINTSDGLSQGFISSVLQDSEGFIWAATKNGLDRFDGKKFKTFNHDPYDPYSLSHDFVTSLAEYDNFIVVGTNGGGISILDKRTRLFYRMPDHLFGGDRLKSPAIKFLNVDYAGNLWVVLWEGYIDGVLQKISLPDGFWEDLTSEENPWSGTEIDQITEIAIQSFLIKKDGKHLFYNKDSRIYKLDVSTNEKTTYSFPEHKFFGIRESENGVMWFAFKNGVKSFDGSNWKTYFFEGNFEQIVSVRFDDEFILISGEKELFTANLDKERSLLVKKEVLLDTDGIIIISYMNDWSSNVWMGTSGYGIYKISHQPLRFRTYFKGKSIYSQPFFGNTSGVGFFNGQTGLNCSEDIVDHPICIYANRLPPFNYRSRYVNDPRGKHWFLYQKNNQHYRLSSIDSLGNMQPPIPIIDSEGRPGYMKLGKDGHIWLGINGFLYKFNPSLNFLKKFDYRHLISFGHDVKSIKITADGRVWLGTNIGLLEVIPNGNEFEFNLIENDPDNRNSLSNNDVTSLHIDKVHPEVLWMGTIGGGLNRLNIETRKFSHFTKQNGLPDQVIYGILQDINNNLWLSTNRGIVEFNPGEESVVSHYTVEDGLQGDEFNTWAFAEHPDGRMAFGGIFGLNVFNPRDFAVNTHLPQTYITDIWVNGELVQVGDSTEILSEAPEYTSSITLTYNNNKLALEFAALEYTLPSKNQFQYYLEGVEKEWANTSTDSRVEYLNIAPGKYTFKVKSSNGDGVYNPEITSLNIRVLPPWYATTVAYLFYVILVGILIYLIVSNHISKVRLKEKLKFQSREARRIKEIEEFKSRLFTHLTHEFRTPLTLIIGVEDKVSESIASLTSGNGRIDEHQRNDLEQGLEFIKGNAIVLRELIDQILDLSLSEDNRLELTFIQSDIVEFLSDLIENYRPIGLQTQIEIVIEKEVSSLIMDFDPEKIRLIFSNFLSNALKYAPPKSTVKVKFNSITSSDTEFFTFEIRDSGEGIDPDELPYVFEPFNQENNISEYISSNGIRLSLTKKLVGLMEGEIEVQSVPSKETCYSVKLPVTNEAALAEPKSEISEIPSVLHGRINDEEPAELGKDEHPNTLLLVEDSPYILELLKFILGGKYNLIFAEDGKEGVESALENIPDLIISDVMMPVKNGYELCDILKRDPSTSHIPIILLTAKVDEESKIVGLKRGADYFIGKPFRPEELQLTVENALESINRLRQRYQTLDIGRKDLSLNEHREDSFILEVHKYFDSNLDQSDISQEDICRVVGMNRFALNKKIQALTGKTAISYLKFYRLEKSRELLLGSELTVSEIAYQVGFNDPKYFSRAFSEAYNSPPTEYRKQR